MDALGAGDKRVQWIVTAVAGAVWALIEFIVIGVLVGIVLDAIVAIGRGLYCGCRWLVRRIV